MATLLAAINGGVSNAEQKTPKLIESGVYVHINGEHEIFWVDDRTVFFKAYPPGKPRNDAEIKKLISGLFLWTLGEAPKSYATGIWNKSLGGDYCAANGEVHYTIDPRNDESTGDKIFRFLSGRPGFETVWEIKESKPGEAFSGLTPSNRPGSVGGLPCRTFVDTTMKGRLWATDAAHEFYLDFGPRKGSFQPSGDSIVLMRSNQTDLVKLPIKRNQVTPQCTQYNRLTHSFLVWDCIVTPNVQQEQWKVSGCWPYWWIRLPQGKVDQGCIPYGSWSWASHELVPTRVGMHFVSMKFADGRNSRDPGSAGLYRIDSGKATRVLPGIIHKASVSPNGCKIAFNYAPHYHAKAIGTPGQTTVAVIDVCAGSEGKIK